jgi:hypothetical protein
MARACPGHPSLALLNGRKKNVDARDKRDKRGHDDTPITRRVSS